MGPLYFYQRPENRLPRCTVADAETEWQRFRTAQATAIEQLGQLAERARVQAGDEAARLFAAHQMMARDPDYESAIEALIRERKQNAEWAVADASERFSAMFAAMDDAYMQERSADVKDVSGRILAALTGAVRRDIDSSVPVILCADDLSPSETVQLDKSKILGFVTSAGSGSSHTAILARTMGIPAIIGVGVQLKPEFRGRHVIVDGGTGSVVLDADETTRARLLQKRTYQQQRLRLLRQFRGKPSVTADGQRLRLYCNISSPDDVYAVQENDGEGIGLFRSEFLYLNSDDYPSEEQQFQAYKKVLSTMGGKEVVIRTLDIGADKRLAYFDLPREENPALGIRGLRICLNRPELFRTQLRALYRASAFGHLSILLPMVTSVWEVKEARKLCAQVMEELRDQGIPYSEHVDVGIMIETPAAAVLSDRLAKVADFFSIGTNDLTQYTLACDRQNSDLGRFFNPHHPAVLRLMKLVAENAHSSGIRCAVCGELAADLALTETFLALGVDELSVAPRSVLPLRQKVCQTTVSNLRSKLVDELTDDRISL